MIRKIKNIKNLSKFFIPSLLVFALAITSLLSIRPFGAFETRRRAAEMPNPVKGSRLSFAGPTQVHLGDKFSVDLVLNTTNDPYYSVSRVDAIVDLNQGGPIPIPLTSMTPVASRSGVLGVQIAQADPVRCSKMPTYSDSCGSFVRGPNGCPWVNAPDGIVCASRTTGAPGICQNGKCIYSLKPIITPSCAPGIIIDCPAPPPNCFYIGENSCSCGELICSITPSPSPVETTLTPTPPKTCILEGNRGNGIDGDSCCKDLKSVSNAYPPICITSTNADFICTKCEDGICGPGENYCNCPRDCPTPITPTLTPTPTAAPSCSDVGGDCGILNKCCNGLVCESPVLGMFGKCVLPTPTIAITPTPTIHYTGGVSVSGISAGKIFDSYPVLGGPGPGEAGYLLPSMRFRTMGMRNVLGTQSNVVTPAISPISISSPPIPISGIPTPVSSPPPYPSETYTITGVNNYAVNPDGTYKGFSGKDVFATLTYVATQVGKVELKLVYKDENATDDSNILSYLTTKPAEGQKPQERLISPPESFVIEVLPPITPTPTLASSNSMSWTTKTVSLDSGDFYIVADGKKYIGKPDPGTTMSIHSDPGDSTYTTLELIWTEQGTEMRLFMYFAADKNSWWVTELRTYNGQKQGDWIYYKNDANKFFQQNLGIPFVSDDMTLNSYSANQLNKGIIHFGKFKLHGFINSAVPTPPDSKTRASLSCTPSTDTYKVGDIFTVDMVLDTHGYPAFGADVRAIYDTSMLDFVGTPTFGLTDITKWTNPIKGIIDQVKGQIILDYGNNQPAFTGKTPIGRLTFRVTNPGQAQFNFIYFQQYDDNSTNVSKVWGTRDGVNIINNLTDVTNCIYVTVKDGDPTATPQLIAATITPDSQITSTPTPTPYVLTDFCKQVQANVGANINGGNWSNVKQYDINADGIINTLDEILCIQSGK